MRSCFHYTDSPQPKPLSVGLLYILNSPSFLPRDIPYEATVFKPYTRLLWQHREEIL